jgi:hypothetical protein
VKAYKETTKKRSSVQLGTLHNTHIDKIQYIT